MKRERSPGRWAEERKFVSLSNLFGETVITKQQIPNYSESCAIFFSSSLWKYKVYFDRMEWKSQLKSCKASVYSVYSV